MKRALLVLTIASTFALGACSEPAETASTGTPSPDLAAPGAEPAPMPATSADAAASTQAGGDVVDGAMNSPDHTTLVAAVQAAGLVDTLKGPGPFTVFAPTNAAFGKLPAGTVDKLLTPEMKSDLTKLLTYHVVPGKVDAATLTSQIEAGNGTATLTTVQGGTLTASAADGNVIVTDAQGNKATVTRADLMASNGVIHVVDTVLMP